MMADVADARPRGAARRRRGKRVVLNPDVVKARRKASKKKFNKDNSSIMISKVAKEKLKEFQK